MSNKYSSLIIKEIEKTLKNNINQSLAHRLDHFLRVSKKAQEIATKIDNIIDLEILEIACLLHDIDQPYNNKKDHVERSIIKAKDILNIINYPKEKIEEAIQIIKEHSSEKILKQSSMEAKILYVSDKIDGLGDVGIARVFILCGQRGLSIKETVYWYRKKLNKAIPFMPTDVLDIVREEFDKKIKITVSFLEKIENNQNRRRTQ